MDCITTRNTFIPFDTEDREELWECCSCPGRIEWEDYDDLLFLEEDGPLYPDTEEQESIGTDLGTGNNYPNSLCPPSFDNALEVHRIEQLDFGAPVVWLWKIIIMFLFLSVSATTWICATCSAVAISESISDHTTSNLVHQLGSQFENNSVFGERHNPRYDHSPPSSQSDDNILTLTTVGLKVSGSLAVPSFKKRITQPYTLELDECLLARLPRRLTLWLWHLT